MTAKWFTCPDKEQVEILDCLSPNGCRLGRRCSTVSYLEMVGFDREFKGISPSSAGNGPRQIYLKAVTDYAIDPQDRTWAALGTAVHNKLSLQRYTRNVLSEEPLSDELMKGIPDVLEADEERPGLFILSDYKTWGSYKVAKALGVKAEKTDEPVLDDYGEPVILKSGKNKGEVKTKQRTVITTDPAAIDLRSEELQLNRYRIFFEQLGFPISRMQIQAIIRDGGTYMAESRGITQKMYLIDVPKLPTTDVYDFYQILDSAVTEAFHTGRPRLCNRWESWEGRRCNGFCEVSEACKEMEVRK